MGTVEKISDPDWAADLIKKGLTPNKVAHAFANRQVYRLAKLYETRPQNIKDLATRWGISRDDQLLKEYGYLPEGA